MTTETEQSDLLAPLRSDIALIEPASPAELVLANFDRWTAFVEKVKELDQGAKAAVSEWIKVNGPLDGGTFFYWLTHPKDTKCTDMPGAILSLVEERIARFTALLEEHEGDMTMALMCFISEFMRDFICSDPFKHGAVKQVLGEETAALFFTTTVKDKLESGEALPKKLQKVEKQFLKPTAHLTKGARHA